MKLPGVEVVCVFPESLAEDAGIRAGDRLLTINGETILDQLNYQFLFSGSDDMDLVFQRPGGKQKTVYIEHGGNGLGLDLAQDALQTCKQNCVFCFVQQMPKHYRQSLYLKDEDIRLSFLYGHFTTLSSSDDQELDRVIREKLSPIHVSVHATDPVARIKLFRNPREGNILTRIDRLIQGGIQMHTQVVLVPGWNDGGVWEKTLEELWARRATGKRSGGILSLSCVPVGLTAHREGLPALPSVSQTYAKDWVRRYRPAVRRFAQANDGEPWLLLADEWFARSGEPLPGRSFYSKSWSQLENGVGLLRRFMEHSKRFVKSQGAKTFQGKNILMLTGESFAPYLETAIQPLNHQVGSRFRVLAVPNRAFGTNVTVAGLLCGQDLLDAALQDLKKHGCADAVVVPSAALCRQAGITGQYAQQGGSVKDSIFLDDMSLKTFQERLGTRVLAGGDNLTDLLKAYRAKRG